MPSHSCSEMAVPSLALKRRARWVFAAALGFFLATHGGHFYSTDADTVYSTALALVTKGSLAIQPGMTAARGRNGRWYGFYPIGLPLLESPFIWAGHLADDAFPGGFAAIAGPNVSIFYPENFATFGATLLGPLLGALAAAEFWIIAELLGYRPGIAAWLTIILGFSTQFWPAARDSFPQMAVAFFLLLAVRHALTPRGAISETHAVRHRRGDGRDCADSAVRRRADVPAAGRLSTLARMAVAAVQAWTPRCWVAAAPRRRGRLGYRAPESDSIRRRVHVPRERRLSRADPERSVRTDD